MGYHQRIIAQPDLRVIGGHQRIKVLRKLGIEKITVLVPNRELSEDEYRRLLIQDNLPFGEFNFKMLKTNFKIKELTGWGMPLKMLGGLAGSTDPEKEWKNMPDYEGLEPCFRKVVVNFDTPEDVTAFFDLIKQDHTEKTKSVWFPKKERRNLEDERWQTELPSA